MAISFVQIAAKDGGAASSTTQAFGSNLASGNTVIVGITWNDQSVDASSVTDSLGNTYNVLLGPTNWSGSFRSKMYYAKNVAAGACTITVTMSGTTGGFLEVYQAEYSGLDTSAPLDQSAVTTGTSTTPTSPDVTTTQADELIVGYGEGEIPFSAVGSGFSQRSTFNSNLWEDKIVAATGTYNASYTMQGSAAWVMHVATFKAPSVAGFIPYTLTPHIGPLLAQ